MGGQRAGRSLEDVFELPSCQGESKAEGFNLGSQQGVLDHGDQDQGCTSAAG